MVDITWGETARHDHAGQVVALYAIVIGVQVNGCLRWICGSGVDADSV